MKPAQKIPKIQSAHAILILDGSYVLQLRDEKPTIASAGRWAFFGGKINTGETPLKAIKREICEELAIKPAEYTYLWYTDYFSSFEKDVIRTWFFTSDVTAMWPGHKLEEGKAARSFQFNQLDKLDIPRVMRETLARFHQQKERVINRT